jgi:phosphoinositide-3-kinase regulatory subunit 4
MFPESFYSFLHNYVASVNEMPSNPPYTNPATIPSSTTATVKSSSSTPTVNTTAASAESHPDILPSDSDHRLERIWADYESIEPYIFQEASEEAPEMDVKIEYNTLAPLAKPLQACAFYSASQQDQLTIDFKDILPVELHIPNRDSKLHTLPGGRLAALEGV